MNIQHYNRRSGICQNPAVLLCQDKPDGKNIPIIAMTANSFAEDVQASLDAGMNAHLSKPIVIEEVIKTILRYVHND